MDTPGTTQTMDITFAGFTAKQVDSNGNTQIVRPGYAFENAATVAAFSFPGALTQREVGIAVCGYLGPVLATASEMRTQYIKQIANAPIEPEAKAIVLASLKDPLTPFTK